MNWSNAASIATVIGAIGIWAAVIQVFINRKQLHLNTIKRCIDEFRSLVSPTHVHYSDADAIKYVDLVNEELFYFQHNYIPKIIAYEWIDGMLDYIPLFDKNGKVLNEDFCIERLCKKPGIFFKDYPRVKHTFTVLGHYDLDDLYSQEPSKLEIRLLSRRNLIQSIYENLKRYNF